MRINTILGLALFSFPCLLMAQNEAATKFAQLGTLLPTPNEQRVASGAPGKGYWQQRADYDIHVELDDNKQKISGEETITYYNNSPDHLDYLWLQLDQNLYAKNSMNSLTETRAIGERMSFSELQRMIKDFDGGCKLDYVKDGSGKELPYTIVNTMMRVDIPSPLKPGDKYTLKLRWWYYVNDGGNYGGRTGYEFFPKDSNYTYNIAQFYPRMCRYDDVNGWQNKQYLGTGEFTLSFGNYDLHITVPEDHIVAATGELKNASAVLTAEQRNLLEKAKTSTEPVVIVSQDEAKNKEKDRQTGKKTWVFHADNVRDVAFASSRKYIWDAMGVPMGNKTVMAMSFYPKECNPLWGQFSTRVVAHTIRTYSKFTFDYPYPVAISTHAKFTGMEYPMISFNFGRPEADGTYSEGIKNAMIGVITHEVGHNYFPMIVNSDERQWMWMDEGLNTFVEFLTEKEWDKNYPTRNGQANKITKYMSSDKSQLEPIMTNPESILSLGSNAYGKTATGLNILRETVVGRELFDFAFKTYANRWKFKHPSPADFFRTLEDASGVDLDWFWRGWFYGVDPVDIVIDKVRWLKSDTKNPEIEKPIAKAKADSDRKEYITDIRNKDAFQSLVEKDPGARDFYTSYDPNEITAQDRQEYEKYIASLSDQEKKALNNGLNFYQVDFVNKGGMIMPIILLIKYTDGTEELHRIPAEIWRQNSSKVSKVFYSTKEAKQFILDPYLETADIDTENNYFPRVEQPTRFQMYKSAGYSRYGNEGDNPMQKARKAKEGGDKKN